MRFPVGGVTEDYKLPCACWELNSDPLQEQSVLLTTEPSLLPLVFGCVFFSPETGFLCVALADLELTLLTRLALNSEIHLPLSPKVLKLQACATTYYK